ncbi:MAG: SDR family NAD(P)-dependent oxidoreductase, partial [Gammaproteobacteria bacterium]
LTVPCNIGDKAQLQNLVDKTREHFGQIDILVCNAAVNPYFGPAADCPDEAFDKVMGSNVRSNHWLCNMVIPEMVARKDGAIIIISSIGGLKGSAMLGAYSISKAADFQLARNIAVEHGADNVRANAIAPGLIKTYFAQALWDNPDILEQSTASTPLKRIGMPDEIAGAAVFLAAQAGAFMTGQQMVIDGGQTIS